MTNRERISKTDICDYLTDTNEFLMDGSLGADCIMLLLRKNHIVVCPKGVRDCHSCISVWLNEEEKDNE
jgi:hypothetical protein